MITEFLSDCDLFDLFVGGQTSIEEIAQLDIGMLTRQVSELRRDEPDDIAMTDAEVATSILRYAEGG